MAFANFTVNLTTSTTPSSTPPGALPFDIGAVSLGSGIVLLFTSPATIILNSLLLFTIYKDPFKTFQSPSTVFLTGLAVTDLVTGLIEPLLATCYFLAFFKDPRVAICHNILTVIGILANAAMNSSFLIVLAFTVAQYLAVSWPLKYKGYIDTRRSIICIVLVWIYAIVFAMLQQFGVPEELFDELDLFLHTTITMIVMVAVYVLLQRSFRRKIKRGFTLRAESSMHNEESNPTSNQQLNMEKKFIRINLLLVLLLVFCSIPSGITWYLYLFNDDLRQSPKLFLARVIIDNTLWLKSMLDPVVYAWRLPKYRKALRSAFTSR